MVNSLPSLPTFNGMPLLWTYTVCCTLMFCRPWCLLRQYIVPLLLLLDAPCKYFISHKYVVKAWHPNPCHNQTCHKESFCTLHLLTSCDVTFKFSSLELEKCIVTSCYVSKRSCQSKEGTSCGSVAKLVKYSLLIMGPHKDCDQF